MQLNIDEDENSEEINVVSEIYTLILGLCRQFFSRKIHISFTFRKSTIIRDFSQQMIDTEIGYITHSKVDSQETE